MTDMMMTWSISRLHNIGRTHAQTTHRREAMRGNSSYVHIPPLIDIVRQLYYLCSRLPLGFIRVVRNLSSHRKAYNQNNINHSGILNDLRSLFINVLSHYVNKQCRRKPHFVNAYLLRTSRARVIYMLPELSLHVALTWAQREWISSSLFCIPFPGILATFDLNSVIMRSIL